MIERQPSFEEGMEAIDMLDAAIEATQNSSLSPEDKAAFVDIVGREVAEDAFGDCDFPRYCKFYGEDASCCDRSCGENVWDQI